MVLKSSAARGRDIKFSGLPAQIDAFGFGHRDLLNREGRKRHSAGAVLRLPLARSKRSSRREGAVGALPAPTEGPLRLLFLLLFAEQNTANPGCREDLLRKVNGACHLAILCRLSI